MSKCSPGPWRWDNEYSLECANVRPGVPWGMSMYFEPGAPTTDEDRANMRLIAAAPELLEALKEVNGTSDDMCLSNTALALIRRIEGEK